MRSLQLRLLFVLRLPIADFTFFFLFLFFPLFSFPSLFSLVHDSPGILRAPLVPGTFILYSKLHLCSLLDGYARPGLGFAFQPADLCERQTVSPHSEA